MSCQPEAAPSCSQILLSRIRCYGVARGWEAGQTDRSLIACAGTVAWLAKCTTRVGGSQPARRRPCCFRDVQWCCGNRSVEARSKQHYLPTLSSVFLPAFSMRVSSRPVPVGLLPRRNMASPSRLTPQGPTAMAKHETKMERGGAPWVEAIRKVQVAQIDMAETLIPPVTAQELRAQSGTSQAKHIATCPRGICAYTSVVAPAAGRRVVLHASLTGPMLSIEPEGAREAEDAMASLRPGSGRPAGRAYVCAICTCTAPSTADRMYRAVPLQQP